MLADTRLSHYLRHLWRPSAEPVFLRSFSGFKYGPIGDCARNTGAYRFVPVADFAAAFTQSKAGAAQAAALAEPFQVTKATDNALAWTKHALTGLHPPLPP